MSTSGIDSSTQDQHGNRTAWWAVGIVALLISIIFSGLLTLKQLGLIGDSLPGCGPESACAAVTNGPWGRIPWIQWPVSYLGLAWFIGLAIGWLLSKGVINNTFRWLARLGAAASVVFLLVMIAGGAICPYCLFAHVGSLIFWIVVETNSIRSHSSKSVVVGMTTFLIATLLLAGTQIIRTDIENEQAVKQEQELVDAVIAKSNKSNSASNQISNNQSSTKVDIDSDLETIERDDSDIDTRDLLEARWITGDPEAPVHVVMISDYQCPDCRKFEMEMQEIMARRGDVSLSVKHFPMCTDCNPNLSRNMHANACWAARTAEAAGILGGEEAFWRVHEWLFENRGRFENGHLPSMLWSELGFDQREFTELMTSDETLQRVQGDISDGVELGLFYTPMIFVNGVEVKWHMLPVNLSATVDRIANAIERGDAVSEQVAPPVGIDKYVADWRDGRKRRINEASRTFRRSGVADDAPEVIAFIDFVSPNSAVFLEDIREIDETSTTNLILRVNPLDHDCNPNLPARIKRRPGSCLGARALKAAGIVGGDDAYFEMAFWLIDHGPELGKMQSEDVIDQAVSMGMDREQFSETLNSAGVSNLIAEDIAEFKRNGFPHLPAVIVENRQVPRLALENESVIAAVIEELNRNQQ